jgi:hypothetical protein
MNVLIPRINIGPDFPSTQIHIKRFANGDFARLSAQ